MTKDTMRSGLAAALVVGLLATAVPAFGASGSGDKIATGNCSMSSTWKLKAGLENGMLDVEFDVDQNVNRQLWSVTITDNGHSIFEGTARTKGPSGSFEVNVLTRNRAGTDNLVADAMEQNEPFETCHAELSF